MSAHQIYLRDDVLDEPIRIPMVPPDNNDYSVDPIRDLIENALPLEEGMAPELLALCKTHPVVCSVIAFALHRAVPLVASLRKADDMKEIHRAQGGAEALQTFTEALIVLLTQVEEAQVTKENDNVQENAL